MISPLAATPASPALAAAQRHEAAPPAPAAAAPQAPTAISPRLRIDGALNLVVLEFRSPDGEVQHSLPTPRELAAYRDEPRKDPALPALDRAS